METKQLTDTLFVAEQIKLADLKVLAKAGFKTIINNRPDGEALRQPRSHTLAKRATKLGLDYRYIPVKPSGLTDDNLTDFQAALSSAPVPALAFCRSGTRSTTLWAHAVAGEIPVNKIVNAAQEAGYDLSKIKTKLEKMRAKTAGHHGQT